MKHPTVRTGIHMVMPVLAVLAALTLTAGCSAAAVPSPPVSPTPAATASPVPVPTPSPSPTPTATPSHTPSPTPSPTLSPSPTPSPTPSPSPTPAPLTGTITLQDEGGRVNIRSGPGAGYEVIGQMSNHETVVIDRAGIRWHRIAYDGGAGYVTADAVSLDAEAAMEPVAAVVAGHEDELPAGCGQVILSLVDGTAGWVWVLEEKDGRWQVVLGPYDANMGRKGPGKEKAGDEKTPLGVFVPDLAFGAGDAPEGAAFPWRTITSHSLWVGDSQSRCYNQWVEDGSVTGDYDVSKCERLSAIMPQYELALNYGYNPRCTPYAGSALFLHVWKAKGVGTAGCTAVSRDAMLDILRRLDPAKEPAFMQWVLPGDDGR